MTNHLLMSVVMAPHANTLEATQEAMGSVIGQSYGHVQWVVIAPTQGGNLHRLLQQHAHLMTLVPGAEPATTPPGTDDSLYAAFNAGLAQVHGEVVVFLGGNERLAASSVLSEVAPHFADPSVDAVYGDLQYVQAQAPGSPLRRWSAPPLTRAALARGWLTPLAALWVRRIWFERLGGFDLRLGAAADFDLVVRLFRQPGFRAVQIPKVYALRRVDCDAGEAQKAG